MEPKINLDQNQLKSPYRVPDGYFSDLNHAIIAGVESQSQQQPSGIRRYLRLAGFAVCFASMVVGLTWGFRVITETMTGEQSSLDESVMLSMYNITTEDILQNEEYIQQNNEQSYQQIVDELILSQNAIDINYYLTEEDMY